MCHKVPALGIVTGMILMPLLLPAHCKADDTPRTVDSTIWEKAIEEFEAQDRQNPPPQNAILFIGGSNIRRWNLQDNFPDLPVINRGFGGSMIADAIYYFDRVVTPYRAEVIVLYGGANDMGRGKKTPHQVLADFQTFVDAAHKLRSDTRILYISLPHFYSDREDSEVIAKVKLVNQLIAGAIAEDSRLTFVDVNKAMADAEGQPRKELFQQDGIHMNAKGYAIWAARLRLLQQLNRNR